MIFHPGVLTLVAGSFLGVAVILFSASLGFKIRLRWDINSSSMEQLSLERKTYLVSSAMNIMLGMEILLALLFIYTIEDIHHMFVGAMCATGTLNANTVGWNIIYAKVHLIFLSSIWIALNYLGNHSEYFPLVKTKYTLLLILLPIASIDAYLQVKYFSGLKPDVITSCCGALFSQSGENLASTFSALSFTPAKIAFLTSAGFFLLSSLLVWMFNNRIFKYLTSLTAVGFLFGATLFGLLVGITDPLRGNSSLTGLLDRLHKKWSVISTVFVIIFLILAVLPVVFSDFTMMGY